MSGEGAAGKAAAKLINKVRCMLKNSIKPASKVVEALFRCVRDRTLLDFDSPFSLSGCFQPAYRLSILKIKE